MSSGLSDTQKWIICAIQEPLPLCRRPFSVIAERLGLDAETVLSQLRCLVHEGFVRRFRAGINYRSFGRVATLVAARVEQRDMSIVAGVINALPVVSHNYIRNHQYNLWFTIQADSLNDIEKLLRSLSRRLGTEFHSMPAKKVFKLDVRFAPDPPDTFSRLGQSMAPYKPAKASRKPARPPDNPVANPLHQPMDNTPADPPVPALGDIECRILRALQDDLEITEYPFDFLAGSEMPVESVLHVIESLIDRRLIRSIRAVVDQYRLGYHANAMFCAEVQSGRIEDAGRGLARYDMVTHCYERGIFPNWPYNLFAMLHAGSMENIRTLAVKFTTDYKIGNYLLLPTVSELKKQPVTFNF